MIKHSICGALSEDMIDQILADSFPASDPPPWTGGREIQPCSGFIDDLKGDNGNSESELLGMNLPPDRFKESSLYVPVVRYLANTTLDG